MAEICKLCRKPEELQDSHIISEFFYKLIYDSNPRRFRVISADSAVPVQYEQKGLREPLLCKSCEGKFGRWEDYAKRTFVDCKNIQIVQAKGEILIQNSSVRFRSLANMGDFAGGMIRMRAAPEPEPVQWAFSQTA